MTTNAFTGFTMNDDTVTSLLEIAGILSNLPENMCKAHAAAATHFLAYDIMPVIAKGARNARHVENLMKAARVHLAAVREVPSINATSRKSSHRRISNTYKYITHADCK